MTNFLLDMATLIDCCTLLYTVVHSLIVVHCFHEKTKPENFFSIILVVTDEILYNFEDLV